MARSQWFIVARREFLERVRTKWFVIVTLLGPLAMIGIIVVPAYLNVKSEEQKVTIEILDRSGRQVGERLAAAAAVTDGRFKFAVTESGTTEEMLLAKVEANSIDGFLVFPSDVVNPTEATKAVEYRGGNSSSLSLGITLRGLVTATVIGIRLEDKGIGEDQLGALLSEVSVVMRDPEGASGAATFIAGYIVMFLLYMSILLYAMNVMRGVIQEKTSRVVEIIISAVKPRSLMFGKIIGVGSVGLFQLTLWAVIALLLISFRGPILGLFGIDGSASITLPEVTAVDLVLILTYFLLGFFLYASLYAAIGAMVSSEQEATQLQMPVVLLLIVPVMCVQIVSNNPRGPITQVLTLFPFSGPVLMPMRVLLDGASPLEIALSLVILIATIALSVAAAAKIYRLGILLTGKPPGFRTVWRWLRH